MDWLDELKNRTKKAVQAAQEKDGLVALDRQILRASIVEAMITDSYTFQFHGGHPVDILNYLVDNICSKFGSAPTVNVPSEEEIIDSMMLYVLQRDLRVAKKMNRSEFGDLAKAIRQMFLEKEKKAK